jgi:hypothetical protein
MHSGFYEARISKIGPEARGDPPRATGHAKYEQNYLL